MATQVKCISKDDRKNPNERITHLGGDGWYKTSDDVIYRIENRIDSYYVIQGGHRSEVVVATRNGRKYLKTTNDGDEPNNLLSLPQCR